MFAFKNTGILFTIKNLEFKNNEIRNEIGIEE